MALKAQIDITANASGVETGVGQAKKSINSLGVAVAAENSRTSKSIDNYVAKLQQQQKMMSMSSREAEVYKLGLRGASDAQLKAADSSLKLAESYERTRAGLVAFAAIAVTATIAAAAAFDQLVKKAGDFQDMAEKIGDSAESIASLAVSAAVGGVQMETVVSAANKLTKSLTEVNDESDAAGAAIGALGLNVANFKSMKPADQMEAVAKALNGFEDGASKSAVAMSLFGKAGAEMLPFLKELGSEGGRQNILTQEQIELADEYADKQAKLQAQIGMYAAAIATQMLPAYNDLQGAFLDLIKGIGGVSDGAKGLNNSTAIQDFADSAANALAFLIDMADGVARVFAVVGKAIAGTAAIAFQPWQQARSIAKAMDDDIRATLSRPMMSQLVDERRAARKLEEGKEAPKDTRPALVYKGAPDKSKASKAAAEAKALAKAQLDSDLSDIKTAADRQSNIYSNAEKVMQALRSASLIDEKEYYASKLAFLNLNSQSQESELQASIARLQQEKLTGKEKLENNKKIAEAEAKLEKVRADATANVQILGIQQADSIRKVAQAYKDATEAAQDYLNTVQKQYDREVAGIGRGAKFNKESADRNQIEDKFTGRKQELARDLRNNDITAEDYAKYLKLAQDTYTKEAAIYEDSRGKIADAQADSMNGITKALEGYRDKSLDIAGQTAEAFTNAFQSIEDALTKFVTTGKLDFKSLADSIIADFVRIQIRQAMGSVMGGGSGGSGFMGILGGIAGMFGGTGATASLASSMGGDSLDNMLKLTNNFSGRARGGPVSARSLYQVNEKGPELLNMGGKQYLMMAGQGGSVTSNADSGNQSPNITVHVNSTTGDGAEIRRSAAAGAKAALNIMSGARRYG